MNKFQLQRLFENDLTQFAIKVLIVSIGVIFTAYVLQSNDIDWFRFIGEAFVEHSEY